MTYKLNISKELFDKWLVALRSGEYKQGFGRLCADDRYCCLGVLCEVDGLEKEVHPMLRSSVRYYRKSDGPAYGSTSVYPGKIATRTDSSGRVTNSISSVLMEMNDGQYKSFLEIADWLEQNCTV